jgi:hypothetical protein
MAKKVKSLARSLAMKKSWAKRRNSPMREQARKRTVAKPQGEPKFWILWMPSSHKPPKVRFGTLEKVREVAGIMLQKYRQPIHVMASVELYRFKNPDVEVIAYNGPPAKDPVAKPCPPETFHVSATPPPLANHGQMWDQQQDNRLTELWYQGIRSIPELAFRMGRSELAIEYRLESLMIRPRRD